MMVSHKKSVKGQSLFEVKNMSHDDDSIVTPISHASKKLNPLEKSGIKGQRQSQVIESSSPRK